MTVSGVLRRSAAAVSTLEDKLRKRRYRADALRAASRLQHPYFLHVGCGSIHFDGWLNTDFYENRGLVDFAWDATEAFPLDAGSCSLIYSEHFLEHIPVDKGALFLSECHRLLTIGGV